MEIVKGGRPVKVLTETDVAALECHFANASDLFIIITLCLKFHLQS